MLTGNDETSRCKKERPDPFRVDSFAVLDCKGKSRDAPGFKFHEWELKGVPLRMEVGPKDVQKQSVTLVQRITLDGSAHEGKEPKSFVPQAGLTEHVTMLMDQIQQSLYQRALKFLEEHTFEAKNYDELKERVEQGFVRCWWAGSCEDEEKIQEET